jgi:hypothetical protein
VDGGIAMQRQCRQRHSGATAVLAGKNITPYKTLTTGKNAAAFFLHYNNIIIG